MVMVVECCMETHLLMMTSFDSDVVASVLLAVLSPERETSVIMLQFSSVFGAGE